MMCVRMFLLHLNNGLSRKSDLMRKSLAIIVTIFALIVFGLVVNRYQSRAKFIESVGGEIEMLRNITREGIYLDIPIAYAEFVYDNGKSRNWRAMPSLKGRKLPFSDTIVAVRPTCNNANLFFDVAPVKKEYDGLGKILSNKSNVIRCAIYDSLVDGKLNKGLFIKGNIGFPSSGRWFLEKVGQHTEKLKYPNGDVTMEYREYLLDRGGNPRGFSIEVLIKKGKMP